MFRRWAEEPISHCSGTRRPDDGHLKSVAWFQPAIDFAMGPLAHPRFIVCTHCAAGINRGPSIAYSILRAQGLDEQLAFLMLKKARPQVNVAYRNDADAALLTQGGLMSESLLALRILAAMTSRP